MNFGQFIDHDLAETPVNRCDDNSPIECCEDCTFSTFIVKRMNGGIEKTMKS